MAKDFQMLRSLKHKTLFSYIVGSSQTHTLCKAKLLTTQSLDYEEKAEELISIRVTDHAGLSHSASFKITVLDKNDPPSKINVQGEQICFIEENFKYKSIGALETIDEDVGQDFV